MKNLIIITGTSRGLGLSLAQLFLENGYTVIGLARTNNIKHPQFHFLKIDLSKISKIENKLDLFLKNKKIALKNNKVTLINNAAMVLPINFIEKLKAEDIQLSYKLNLHAPILLSQYVLNRFLKKADHLTICNISSGAAIRPIVNWSIYCSMKSALKMFTDCLVTEFGESKSFKAFSFYPGVMDTKMQETIRKQKSTQFKNVQTFKDLKENNNLLNPDTVAKIIFEITHSPSEISKLEYNVKDYL